MTRSLKDMKKESLDRGVTLKQVLDENRDNGQKEIRELLINLGHRGCKMPDWV